MEIQCKLIGWKFTSRQGSCTSFSRNKMISCLAKQIEVLLKHTNKKEEKWAKAAKMYFLFMLVFSL